MFAVMMSRQAGKNETSAQVEAYLMTTFSRVGGWGVKASPTFKPQTLNSLMRLDLMMENPWSKGKLKTENTYMRRLGRARWAFFSAQPGANVVGATASILLECDEAQDVDRDKWNKEFRPMGASTNTTSIMWGTAWTSMTLLARTIDALEAKEKKDGYKRVFKVPWERVAESVPEYGYYVRQEIDRLGAEHPLIRTQYYLEDIDDEAGMFPRRLQEVMHGDHERVIVPDLGREYAVLVDVAGADLTSEYGRETKASSDSVQEPTGRGPSTSSGRGPSTSSGRGRDFTAVTVVDVDRSTIEDPGIGGPVYRVVRRYAWQDVTITEQYGRLVALDEVWRPRWYVVDATGLGQGLFSLMARRFGERVVPFVFTSKSKSDLGWTFLGICNTGRFRDHRDDGSPEWSAFWRQVDLAEYEILSGPQRTMRWAVNEPGEHDDLLISAAMCAEIEGLAGSYVESAIVRAPDVLGT